MSISYVRTKLVNQKWKRCRTNKPWPSNRTVGCFFGQASEPIRNRALSPRESLGIILYLTVRCIFFLAPRRYPKSYTRKLTTEARAGVTKLWWSKCKLVNTIKMRNRGQTRETDGRNASIAAEGRWRERVERHRHRLPRAFPRPTEIASSSKS